MSLPHTLFECDRCQFCLMAGPDRFPNGTQSLWGRLAVCCACGEEHLVAKTYGEPEDFTHSLYSHAPVNAPTASWQKTSQSCELLPWWVTGATPREEWIDLTHARCVRCDSPALKAWLFHGIQCPRCHEGCLQESFTG